MRIRPHTDQEVVVRKLAPPGQASQTHRVVQCTLCSWLRPQVAVPMLHPGCRTGLHIGEERPDPTKGPTGSVLVQGRMAGREGSEDARAPPMKLARSRPCLGRGGHGQTRIPSHHPMCLLHCSWIEFHSRPMCLSPCRRIRGRHHGHHPRDHQWIH